MMELQYSGRASPSSMEEEEVLERGVHLHTLVDRERKRSKNGDEEAVLDVIQITGDPSAERTAPPRSTHVRSNDVSSLLIQQGARRG